MADRDSAVASAFSGETSMGSFYAQFGGISEGQDAYTAAMASFEAAPDGVTHCADGTTVYYPQEVDEEGDAGGDNCGTDLYCQGEEADNDNGGDYDAGEGGEGGEDGDAGYDGGWDGGEGGDDGGGDE